MSPKSRLCQVDSPAKNSLHPGRGPEGEVEAKFPFPAGSGGATAPCHRKSPPKIVAQSVPGKPQNPSAPGRIVKTQYSKPF